MVGQLITDALRKRLPQDNDEDGEVLDDWLSWFITSQLSFLSAEVPVAGQGLNAAVKALNNNPMDDRVSISPAVSMLETGIRTGSNIVKSIHGKQVDESRMVQDAMMTLGFVTGLPLGQFGKPAGYIANIKEGDEPKPHNVIDFGRGIIAGPAPKRH